ncbi:Epoxide hydrolase [Lasiodiplodia theobromae]|uniref:Acyl-CoA dehydrogenase family member 10 n=1 Tax=Lasiodiplodia theobromae TaxID=45133 RepID=A0A5N5DK14_9PEZI|nr:Epoxide hydrolase [Lasiodiplodia theobromae]KAB2577232.1 Acyl-CoA dehydrogenase family member 10 [Lasiodiplodia theobromae]KAF4538662.1 Epoxide hydrolase [Lasiodiplodia theobromae]
MTATSPSGPPKRPKALLFDIGGVCVVSPFQAILDYERANGIPVGWINTAISAAAPAGAWQRVERGEVVLDDAFFAEFAEDLAAPGAWKAFWEKKGKEGQAPPPPPRVDAKALFWEMMRVSRAPDRWMWPALGKLGRVAREEGGGGFVLGALSNTVVFPEGVVDEKGAVFESGLRLVGPDGKVEVGDVSAAFDVFISSAHVGLRKPDPRIYEMAVKLLDEEARNRGVPGGVQVGDVLFLDDIGQNLKAAREVGMRTLKVDLGKSWKAVRELEGIMGLKLLEGEVPGEKARL